METGVSVMYPQNERTVLNPHDWAYLLWKDILVNPIVEDSTQVKVKFPSGDNWVDYWDASVVYNGGTTHTLTYQLERFPIFIRQGAMLALDVTTDLGLGHGNEFSRDHLTVYVPWATENGEQAVRRWNMPSQELAYQYNGEQETMKFVATPHERSLLLVLHNVKKAPFQVKDHVSQ